MEDLPPGFRFYPTEEELVSFYLPHKLDGRNKDLNRVMDRIIPELDIYKHNPCDLPRNSGEICHGDKEQWFFFIPRQESEARGGRPKRLTSTGYWKATGSPSYVFSSSSNTNHGAIGLKRTMVFYTGRAPTGRKTEWRMNEYKSIQEDIQLQASSSNAGHAPTPRQEFSLCRVYKKSKCLRAFDRRPSGAEDFIMRRPTITIPLPNSPQLGSDHQEASTYPTAISQAQNIIPAAPNSYDMEVDRRCTFSSSGSSSSEDHGQPSQSGQSTGSLLPLMAVDNDIDEPLWDLDKLDWFNCSTKGFEQD